LCSERRKAEDWEYEMILVAVPTISFGLACIPV
jgi:hypothetical protein